MTISIRPEQMQLVRGTGAPPVQKNRLTGKPIESTFQGESTELIVDINNHPFRMIITPPLFQIPAEVTIEFDSADVIVLTE